MKYYLLKGVKMISTIRREQERRELNGEQGFTLIELLIVIIVLGILAAIVVFALGSVTGQSAVAACNADAKTVSIAVSAFEAENPGVTPVYSDLTSTLKGGPYLKSLPTSTYYTVSLLTGDVQVALTSTDPGYAWTAGAGATAVAGETAAQNYEGSAVWLWPATSGTGNLPATANGQNICAGA